MTQQFYIDVRSPIEWRQDHVEGALHIPLDDLLGGELPLVGRDSAIRVFCQHGRRAVLAADYLRQNGFTDVESIGSINDARRVYGL